MRGIWYRTTRSLCPPVRLPPQPKQRTVTLTEWRRPRLFPYGSVFRGTYCTVGITCQTIRRHTTDTTVFLAMALGAFKCTVVEFVWKDRGKAQNYCQTLMWFKSNTCRVGRHCISMRVTGTAASVPLNPLKSSGHYMYHQFNIHPTFCPRSVFMCFVLI